MGLRACRPALLSDQTGLGIAVELLLYLERLGVRLDVCTNVWCRSVQPVTDVT